VLDGSSEKVFNEGRSQKSLPTKKRNDTFNQIREIKMPAMQLRLGAFSAALAILAASSSGALAQKKYDVGATDTEIKIGNITPYSGPASAYGVIGKTEDAYFKKINAEGGINGRKINFISYDDAYSPPKTVEQARKLVESDEVLFIFNPLGTPPNSAIQKYMNSKKVPQLFVATGATKWNDPKEFPWTMGWQPNYQSESRIYAKYILKEKPNAKIAILYQNDDYGKDYVKGLKDGLGAKAASMIIIEDSYEVTQPTIDSNIVKLKSLGADVFFNVTTPKFAEAAAHHQQRQLLDRQRDETGRLREFARHHLVRLPEGYIRSAVEERCRHEGLRRIPHQIFP
jgi:branched-chain amino acid transport system substrate-binding protein